MFSSYLSETRLFLTRCRLILAHIVMRPSSLKEIQVHAPHGCVGHLPLPWLYFEVLPCSYYSNALLSVNVVLGCAS